MNLHFPPLRALLNFATELYQKRKMVWSLAKTDFRQQYLGSYLGIIWAFIQPLVTVTVFWFVFDIGFRSKPVVHYPYILWLISGITPWFFLSDTWTKATQVIIEYQFLVKKIAFSIRLLPIIKMIASSFVHLFFVAFVMILFWATHHPPKWLYLQLLYYCFALVILLLGLGWLTSALQVFFRDTAQVVSIFLQVGFWVTPAFWSASIMPPRVLFWLKFNPMYYIVNGYRNTFLGHAWFWQQHLHWTLYYWSFTLMLFIVGALTFTRLRPHFADVL